jgi:hypothetical protein
VDLFARMKEISPAAAGFVAAAVSAAGMRSNGGRRNPPGRPGYTNESVADQFAACVEALLLHYGPLILTDLGCLLQQLLNGIRTYSFIIFLLFGIIKPFPLFILFDWYSYIYLFFKYLRICLLVCSQCCFVDQAKIWWTSKVFDLAQRFVSYRR